MKYRTPPHGSNPITSYQKKNFARTQDIGMVAADRDPSYMSMNTSTSRLIT